jgi:ABC-type polar amino acid transport system ATPase subunit
MSNPLLRIEGLQKNIGHHQIFSELSFTLNVGESLIVQGKSGCGKTTLLRCIALLDSIDQGQIIFNDRVISTPGQTAPAHRRPDIGMVFQQLYLWPHLTIRENVALPLRLRHQGNKKIASGLATEKLAQLGITVGADRYPHQLSGGQRQRVALARALVHSPPLLLLDEITANLDPETAATVLALIENIIATGTTVILVSHTPIRSTAWSHNLIFDGQEWEKCER